MALYRGQFRGLILGGGQTMLVANEKLKRRKHDRESEPHSDHDPGFILIGVGEPVTAPIASTTMAVVR